MIYLPFCDCLGFQLSHTSASYHRELNFTRTASPCFGEDNSFPFSLEFALISFLLGQCGRSLHWQFVFHKTLTLSLTDMLEVVTLLIWLCIKMIVRIRIRIIIITIIIIIIIIIIIFYSAHTDVDI